MLNVSVQCDGTGAVFALTGELVAGQPVLDFDREVRGRLFCCGIRRFTFDVGGLARISSSGVSALHNTKVRIQSMKGDCEFRGLRPEHLDNPVLATLV